MEVAEALDNVSALFGFGQCREKHAGKDRDDGDHDQ
jgi:hypothetical protein